MGQDSFYLYEGRTQQMPCTVKDKVFFDFNYSQKDKVYAAHNSEFTEIIWFYCSESNSVANGGNGQNDRYVTYNYSEKVWYYGGLPRSAFIDRGAFQYPIGAGNGYLYNHEVGYDDDGSAMSVSLEASPIDIGDGEKFVSISRIIPDVSFQGFFYRRSNTRCKHDAKYARFSRKPLRSDRNRYGKLNVQLYNSPF